MLRKRTRLLISELKDEAERGHARPKDKAEEKTRWKAEEQG